MQNSKGRKPGFFAKFKNWKKNKDFVAKKPTFLNASIFIDNVLKDATVWYESEINDRTEKLAELAYNQVFKI